MITLDCARSRSSVLGALRASICGLGAALAAALAGCSTSSPVSNGTAVTTVTSEAAAGFTAYIVGLYSVSLTRNDGYIDYMQDYGYEQEVDLTKQVDLTELFQAPGVATGTYTSATVGLDFTSPSVYLAGQSTAATVENTSGTTNPGVIYVTVHFDPAHPLVITLDQSMRLALDFDLAASNSIDSANNEVTVNPFVTVTTTPTDNETVRARGLFVVSNPSGGYFIEDIRPFEDNYYGPIGALQVYTNANTYFNIDGTVYTGTAGLTALESRNANTPTIAYGSIGSATSMTPTFNATEVYAGLPVANSQYEQVEGIVSAISGDSLSVLGAKYIYYQGYSTTPYAYYENATVTVGPSTTVTENGQVVSGLSPQSISVGQQIEAVGTGTVNSSGALTLDATSTMVLMESTPIWGSLVSGTDGSAALNLLAIGLFPPDNFNFTGTGTASVNDANPTSYVVNTGAVDESATTAGTLLGANGFVTPFGSAPPDFTATAVTPGSATTSDLIVQWANGTTAPFTSYDSSSMVVNTSSASVSELVTGAEITTLTGTPTINISNGNQFGIGNSTDNISVFSAPSAFASDLANTLNGSTSVSTVVAIGTYDASTNTFNASRVDIALE